MLRAMSIPASTNSHSRKCGTESPLPSSPKGEVTSTPPKGGDKGGLYLHVPFCQSRCIYCDFYSTTLGRDIMVSYARALEREMLRRKHYIECTRVHTIYLGGGTPSLLPAEVLTDIFGAINRHFTLSPDAEVTIEANPDDVTPEWMQSLSATPVNRISMGAQTFNDEILSFLGRRHNAQQTIRAVETCKNAGITNISLDLIYGLPGQTMADWQHDVESALCLGITHLSAYALSYEKGTRLDGMHHKGLVHEADEELSREMYNYLMDATEKAGFLHYEISNFALPGYHSRHNSSYWQGVPYLGLGAGAHSYDGRRTRRANLPDIKAYIESVEGQESMVNSKWLNGKCPDVPHETEVLSNETLYNEFVMTRLRTSDGIPLSELSTEKRQYCLSMAEPHLASHHLRIHGDRLCLTKEGIFTSNDIISDLMV